MQHLQLEKVIKKIDKTKKSDLSLFVGETLAKRANKKNITKIYFDRGCYKYHGRVKLLTECFKKTWSGVLINGKK